jgi:hypothetical protein
MRWHTAVRGAKRSAFGLGFLTAGLLVLGLGGCARVAPAGLGPQAAAANAGAAGAPGTGWEGIVWATGDRDDSGPPQGKLLSDNGGYWGEGVLTGVEYRYESSPGNPRDRVMDDSSKFGRRLLDGSIGGNWWVPVGQNPGRPLVVVFDFKRPCAFTEVDTICTRTPRTSLTIEVRGTDAEPWRTLCEQPLDKSPNKALQRTTLQGEPAGRYLRLSIGSASITWVDEILVWGTAEVSPAYPENLAPLCNTELPEGTLASIPGLQATQFPVSRFAEWRQSIGAHASAPAVWSAWQGQDQPLLPDGASLNAPIHLTVARNETEGAWVCLINTSPSDSVALTVNDIEFRRRGRLSADPRVSGQLLIGGVLSEAADARRVLPFFERGQMLGRSLMTRYLANGADICEYPKVVLRPGGAAPFMLRVTTNDARPGRYVGELSYAGGKAVKVVLDVVDVTLPKPDLWITSWGNETRQFPFETETRRRNDVLTNRQLGVSVYNGLPVAGSKAQMARQYGKLYFHSMVLPGPYINGGYSGSLKTEQLTAEDEAKIAQSVRDLVQQMQSLGLSYDEWFTELWDEPGVGSAAIYGALARIVKKTDPRVRIFMNPCFWTSSGFSPESEILNSLKPYYNEVIDISVPAIQLVGDNVLTKELWAQPRFVRVGYIHPAGRGGRGMAWTAFANDLNGWAYFSYYAGGHPWDYTAGRSLGFAYQMVFPGPNGAIITPIYEDMREGWEDYRLLTELRRRGKEDVAQALLKDRAKGVPLQELRLRALQSLQRK